jgi:hypothetical protein
MNPSLGSVSHGKSFTSVPSLLFNLIVQQAIISPLLVVIPTVTPQLVRDVQESAVKIMMQNLFQENLFPRPEDLTQLAIKSIDDTVDSFPQSKCTSF